MTPPETHRTHWRPGETYQTTVQGVVYTIPREKMTIGQQRAVYAKIDIERRKGREAYDVDPVQGGLGHPIEANTKKELFGFEEINDWRFINDRTPDETHYCELTITIFYK